jgi:branched-chain amino acid transport system substrate-binding protein
VSSRVLASGRAACAWALLAVGIAGCASNGSGSSAVTVSGKTLTIYLSDAATSQPQVARDVLAAEQLAYKQGPSSVGGFTLQLKTLHGKISDQARTAIQDKSAIAYLGEVVPGSSYASLGITNALDLLQVSPTDTALELTQSSPVVSGSPDIYYQSRSTYGQTFVRVVPTSAVEAEAQVQEMRSLGVSRLYVTDDGSPYGAAIANVVKHDAAGAISLSGSLAGADGAFYGGNSPAAAARFFQRASSANPSLKLFAPSALDDPTIAGTLSAARRLYVSAPGFLKQNLTSAGSTFVSQFTTAYGRPPVPQAIFGYEAMSAVLAVLREAGAQAGNRSTVVHDFLSIKNRQSVLGTYSMNSSGDTSIASFVFSRLQQGKLVPFAQAQG